MSYNIAIDGPAGAGKSTIAKKLAKDLSFVYVDTGAMYRALAIFFIRKGFAAEDESGISDAVKDANVSIEYVNGEQQVILNGENVTPILRTEEVGNMASASSVYKAVRAHLLELQRGLAASKDVIMDGRDIGTCILPNADLKIYLTATSAERARRRCEELKQKGENADYEKIKKDIEERDYRDSHREIAPLKQAEDAIYLDSSDLNIDEVVERIKSYIKR